MAGQEYLRFDAGLLEDGSQRSFGQVPGVIGDGGVAVRCRVEPDFVGACCLAVELQAQRPKAADDVAVPESGQRAYQVATISG